MTNPRSPQPSPISLDTEFDRLEFLPNRVSGDDRDAAAAGGAPWYATVADYRDGAVFLVHYAGESEWERHPQGDELVMVLEGATTMTLIVEGEDVSVPLAAQEMVVVPQGVWHRFDTPDGAKIMTVTPQPTDHVMDRPQAT